MSTQSTLAFRSAGLQKPLKREIALFAALSVVSVGATALAVNAPDVSADYYLDSCIQQNADKNLQENLIKLKNGETIFLKIDFSAVNNCAEQAALNQKKLQDNIGIPLGIVATVVSALCAASLFTTRRRASAPTAQNI